MSMTVIGTYFLQLLNNLNQRLLLLGCLLACPGLALTDCLAAGDTLSHRFTRTELRPSAQDGTELFLGIASGLPGATYMVRDTLPFTRQSGMLRLLNTPVGSLSLQEGTSASGQPETYVLWQFTYSDGAVLHWSVRNLPTGIYNARGSVYSAAGILLDWDQACVSVKAIVCRSEPYAWVLRGPGGLSQYRWYRDDILIEAATGDSLVCNRPGRYRMASSDPCVLGMCCPFIVEEDSLPTLSIKTVPATCGGSSDLGDGSLDVAVGEMPELALVTVQVYSDRNELILETQMGSLQNARLTNTLSAGNYRLRLRSESGCVLERTFRIDRGECCFRACPVFTITKRPARP